MFYTLDKFSNKALSFKDFCLSESLRPMRVRYGIDLLHHEWHTNDSGTHWTFFEYEKYYYVVMVEDEGNVGFATSTVFDTKYFSSWTHVLEEFDFTQTKSSSAAKVFSYVMYTILQGLIKFNITEFYFTGQNAPLYKLYNIMIYHNKYFLQSLHDEGYIFDKEDNDKFYFRKE